MEITSDMLTQFGLMNKISTGNSSLDILLCLLLPFLLQRILPQLREYLQKLFYPEKPPSESYRRCIEFNKNNSYYYYYYNSGNDDPPNSMLQSAIMMYINTLPGLTRKLKTANLQLSSGKPMPADDDSCTSDSESDSTNSYDEYEESDSTVLRYQVNVASPVGEWVEIVEGIRFMREDVAVEEGQTKSSVTKFWFETELPDGNLRIDELVKTAFDKYKAMKAKKKKSNTRYLYMPISINESGGEESSKPTGTLYKRYKLSEERGFKGLFHPEKDSILTLVDHFLHKKGKFAIPGYPQKLGFLLHGPPGTGKTTFIKALAHHTGRSVVSIPLARIRTNQELMDIMFDQKCRVQAEDMPVHLPFDKTIFVMEDVDAASDVVNKRTDDDMATPTKLTAEMFASATGSITNSPTTTDTSTSADSGNKGGDQSADGGAKGGSKNSGSSGGMMGPMMAFGKGFMFGGSDQLTLAGLLNVLDGVVDTPNRIIIMTTNHPEKLDPALVRPGRVNKQVYMGRMKVTEALQLVAHYYGKLSKQEVAAVEEVFVDERWSPAELESMCADFDGVEQFVAALREKKAKEAAAAEGAR